MILCTYTPPPPTSIRHLNAASWWRCLLARYRACWKNRPSRKTWGVGRAKLENLYLLYHLIYNTYDILFIWSPKSTLLGGGESWRIHSGGCRLGREDKGMGKYFNSKYTVLYVIIYIVYIAMRIKKKAVSGRSRPHHHAYKRHWIIV